MKKRFPLPFIALAVIFAAFSLGSVSQAQQSTPDAQPPSQQTQQPPDTQAPPASPTPQQPAQTQPTPSTPSQPGSAQPTAAPNASAPSDSGASKEFVGTVVKQGDKYVFQDTASGTTYDIDHQDEVKKFDGKKVRVHGTLDSNGKIIHVQ